jgi:succinate dehydrogenase flavin-adding protein (antitoxin of CptAB toxin-antitoxin module)
MAPAISITLNGVQLVTVSTETLEVFSVVVHGDRVSSDFAHLNVSGGSYTDQENKKHLIWEAERTIRPADELVVSFLQDGRTSYDGKSIEELYSEDPELEEPEKTIEQVFEELARMPVVRGAVSFELSQPFAPAVRAAMQSDEHSFSFSVLWNWLHPERVRVSLSSNTLKSIAERKAGSQHAEFRLLYGQQVVFRGSV